MSRPSYDDVMLRMSELIAERSLCVRRNGAVIVDSTNRVVAMGYNGAPAGFDHGEESCRMWCPRGASSSPASDYSDCISLHAETNALSHANRSETIGGTIFITRPPCLACAKLIAASGIVRVVYPDDTARIFPGSESVKEFLEMCGLDVEHG